MRYYKIDIKSFYGERTISRANYINNLKEECFKDIGKGEIIYDAPTFDYFYLESFDEQKYWEWKLFDAHQFIGEAGWLTPNLFISKKLKKLFEDFNMSDPHFYYASKLTYQNEKFDYYIYQFTGNKIFKHTISYIDFNESVFFDPLKKENIVVDNSDEFILEYKKIYKANGNDNKLKNKKLVLKKYLDFIPLGIIMKDNIVSARLKNAIEENGITGFEFSELDYEVVVDF